jgi:N,N-dimethylformamidase beta subunit-like, C-terminal
MPTHRIVLTFAAVSLAAVLLSLPAPGSGPDPELLEGRAPTAEELQPSVEAAFPAQSYDPGATASLVFFNSAPGVTLQILHSGPEGRPTTTHDEMLGETVSAPTWVGRVRPGRSFPVRIGSWPSGLYVARLASFDGRIGFAPFVLRPRRLGEHPVAVVLPTLTWQAYNLRDDNGDGKGDSWYAVWTHLTVRLGRPFLNRGVPYNFRGYDLPFLHWLARNHRAVDFLSDADLQSARDGDALRRAYRLIVFPGHHEYVTTHEYDVVQRFRDLGGNLMFLSANNFFWRVVEKGNAITKAGQWQKLGRPEAALIGVGRCANDDGQHRGAWIVRDAQAAPWVFAGTGLRDGMPFGNAGIEIDKTTPDSPKGTKVLAEIPNLLGPGLSAQMTYYETPAGAHVFAAGAFTLAGSALQPNVSRLLANLWQRLSEPAISAP